MSFYIYLLTVRKTLHASMLYLICITNIFGDGDYVNAKRSLVLGDNALNVIDKIFMAPVDCDKYAAALYCIIIEKVHVAISTLILMIRNIFCIPKPSATSCPLPKRVWPQMAYYSPISMLLRAW